MNMAFWKGRRVFLTGHTGFKGAWLSQILLNAGAELTGYALPPTSPSLFEMAGLAGRMQSVEGDIRDAEMLAAALRKASPEIVFHMAAQPLVRESYRAPAVTFETNVMGTVNLLECIRTQGGVVSLLNVTTDKVYHNREWHWGYRETDPLDGYDPYSNSKSCSELVTHSYKSSFLDGSGTAVSTARSGNVIGGGDFAADRIVPDCIRAAQGSGEIVVRNPFSTRPYQHVLEPLFAYLLIAQAQVENRTLEGWYNVGPDDCDCVCTGDLVDLFCSAWGEGVRRVDCPDDGPHEASFLKLDCSLAKSVLGWAPRWNIAQAVKKTVEWAKDAATGQDVCEVMNRQIAEFIGGGDAHV